MGSTNAECPDNVREALFSNPEFKLALTFIELSVDVLEAIDPGPDPAIAARVAQLRERTWAAALNFMQDDGAGIKKAYDFLVQGLALAEHLFHPRAAEFRERFMDWREAVQDRVAEVRDENGEGITMLLPGVVGARGDN